LNELNAKEYKRFEGVKHIRADGEEKTGVRLKRRMLSFLLFGSIIPLVLLGILSSAITLSLYRQSAEQIIMEELNQLHDNMEMLMDNMKYISQILVNDSDLPAKLLDYSGQDIARRGEAITYLRERVASYEFSNPNVSNITFFYGDVKDDSGRYDKINNSLAAGDFLDESLRYSTQNLFSYYGPHPTRSIISDYKAISMTRKLNAGTERPVYIYIESGYKVLNEFSSHTLDTLNAIYTVVSEDGRVIYTSDANRIPLGTGVTKNVAHDSILDVRYRVYANQSEHGWGLYTFVDNRKISGYIVTIALGFLFIAGLAVSVCIALGGSMWRRVNGPLTEFLNSLITIMHENTGNQFEKIHILEFDESVNYFGSMKQQMLLLIEEIRKQEQSNAKLEIKLLMYKINPHFLHNTLHTLKCYAVTKGYSDVSGFISSLNRLLMYNMEKNPKTTLGSELSSISDYIGLQRMKYPTRFSIENGLPNTMMNARTPRFILYPLVENAILHGAKGEGEIKLQLDAAQDGRIRIRVRDSGNPLRQDEMDDLMANVRGRKGKGIGLLYVNDVISDFFGTDGTLSFFSDNGENVFEILMPYSIETHGGSSE